MENGKTAMRVLFVHERFGAFGGAEANILATARAFRARGHTVGILSGDQTAKGGEDWAETFASRFDLAPENISGSVGSAAAGFKPDLIYLHKLSNLEAVEKLLSLDAPCVRMVHDHELYCMRGCKYHYLSRKICTRAFSPYCVLPCGGFAVRNGSSWPLLKWVSYAEKKREIELHHQFRRLIVNSSYMKAELVNNGFLPESIELHAPVSPENEAGTRSSFGPRNVIVYAGQIIRGKGVDVLIESLARVQEPFECYILGEGSHRPACERLVRRLGLAERVRFCGFVPREELAKYYRDCSVAVVSSVWPEPFGMVGIEAMRYGLPVVAFDAGGIKEWLIDGYNGYLVPWMDRDRYAARVGELLRDKLLARSLGESGRKLAAEIYDFSNYINGLESLFARLIEETRCEVAS